MAWTTSACLRARPFAWHTTATPRGRARLARATLRRTLSKWHPGFACAVPLVSLGLLTPLMPAALTAGLLLSSGAIFALFAFRAPSPKRIPTRNELPPLPAAAKHTPSQPPLAARFPKSEIAFQQQLQAATSRPTTKRPRLTPELHDRSWTELMARVNHDLRTPLNAVVGFSELMILELFGPLGDERYQDYVQHIRDSATDLLKSAEDTLALTALTTHPNRRKGAATCELEHIAEDAWTFVHRKAGARAIGFTPCIPANLEIMGEPRTLRQILVNMLSEAVARAAHGERVVLTAIADGEMIELSVSVSKERKTPRTRDGSLAICVARTLLEMQGTTLLEVPSSPHGWRAVTVLDRAVQADFFQDRGVTRHRENASALAG